MFHKSQDFFSIWLWKISYENVSLLEIKYYANLVFSTILTTYNVMFAYKNNLDDKYFDFNTSFSRKSIL